MEENKQFHQIGKDIRKMLMLQKKMDKKRVQPTAKGDSLSCFITLRDSHASGDSYGSTDLSSPLNRSLTLYCIYFVPFTLLGRMRLLQKQDYISLMMTF